MSTSLCVVEQVAEDRPRLRAIFPSLRHDPEQTRNEENETTPWKGLFAQISRLSPLMAPTASGAVCARWAVRKESAVAEPTSRDRRRPSHAAFVGRDQP